MAEIIFILVTVYFAYVVHHTVFAADKNSKLVASAKNNTTTAAALTGHPIKHKPVVTAKPTAKIGQKRTSSAKKTVKKTVSASGQVKNPETGEVAKIASSYRMTKRWIKEALVAEKLLDKIYKTTEIDDTVKEKINNALTKLQTLEKYQA